MVDRDGLRSAQAFLRSLSVGDTVVVDSSGEEVTVQRRLRLADQAYEGGRLVEAGAWESADVKVGYGVGRYNFEVSVTAQAMRGVLRAAV